jgi:prepilin-type N-terminal cleavage/methylation domain-containing protein/prepilin-type processing-associated H-X9-DG protein
MKHTSSMHLKGFTLIELLVVIAIIALLAAILFPVFNSAREKARAATCLSNEKSIGLAMQQYVQDYDEIMPFAINTANCSTTPGQDVGGEADPGCQNPLPSLYGATAEGILWTYAIAPYAQTTTALNGGRYFTQLNIFTCPDVNTTFGSGHGPETSYFANTAFQRYNPAGGGFAILCARNSALSTDYLGTKPCPISKISRPADIVVISEVYRNHGSAGTPLDVPDIAEYFWNHGGAYGGTNTTGLALAAFQRHTGGANCLMVDGHAKWYTANQLIADYDDLWGFSSF